MKLKSECSYAEIALLPATEKILVCIPTKNRPEYLGILLSSLLYQSEQRFDVFIAETGDPYMAKYKEAPVERFIKTLRALGHKVTVAFVPVSGNSEVAAVNYLFTEAVFGEYAYLYKTDDDHVLQPDLLERMLRAHRSVKELYGCPALVSAVTPFMHRVAPGLSGPDDHPYLLWPGMDVKLTKIILEDDDVKIDIGHFRRFISDQGLIESDLASNANFLMVPDIRLLWEDTGHSSMNADAVWMVKNRHFFGYRYFFDSGCNSWHVTAPSGGVRDVPDFYDKSTYWDEKRRRHFAHIVRQLDKPNEDSAVHPHEFLQ
jgi:glycosyltransferase involved in cell wall biosynthesis